MNNKFIIVDLETTGNLPKKGDKIIQFAAVVIEDGQITEKYSTLVNPKKTIPIFIEELTGINDVMVKEAPEFFNIAHKVQELLENAYFVAHNVLFDLSFLQEELQEAGFPGFFGPVIDTVEMARILNPTADSYKLSDLAERHGLNHERPHQADSDALVTAELFLILNKRFYDLPSRTVLQLSHLSTGLKSDLHSLLDDLYVSKERSITELPDYLQMYRGVVIRKVSENNTIATFQSDFSFPETNVEKARIMEKAFTKSYEIRPGQFQMMNEIFHSFSNQSHLCIEAGTGIGKSLAYLLPSVYFSKQNHLPVVVSTHTIHLQEQIFKKEISLLAKMLPFSIKAVILKGRNHYLSIDKFIHSLNDEFDNYDTTLTKMQILVWLTETETGDKDELNLSSGGLLFWNKIKNEELFLQNTEDSNGIDFYSRANAQAQTADIIITNHSLLLSNMAADDSILPHFEYAVIDEAHHFEKTAGKYLCNSLDYLQVRMLISQFGSSDNRQLFYKMVELLDKLFGKQGKDFQPVEMNRIVNDLIYETDEFFTIAQQYAAKKFTREKERSRRIQVRLDIEENRNSWLALANSGERISFLFKDLIGLIESLLERIKPFEKNLNIEEKIQLEEVSVFIKDVENFRQTLRNLFKESAESVNWIEVDFRSPQNATTLFSQPVFLGSLLKSKFFNQKKSVVLTSATLTVKDSFAYLLNSIGLEKDKVKVMQVASPFDYEKQVQVLICDDLPEVNRVPRDEYVAGITEHIISIAESTKGRMLILFTSHEMLKNTYELIKESGFLDHYALLAQGITSGSRTRLTRNFQKYDKAILFGTNSFWEGIDIPGEDLTCLVIVRLPFSPPDEPLTAAKSRLISENGGNPFTEYSLPEAVLRFKQGFGRLIRTENDRGIVVIFDNRIVSTKYGKAFLESIPSLKIERGNIDEIVKQIGKWL